MIRHPQAPDLLLFTQHDHALLSGRIAERLDGRLIAKLSASAIEGITLHDCGWPLHDDRPTLNADGQPLHVFEAPVGTATQVWTASARRAAGQNPYAGLLVSLHVLNLSAMVMQHRTSPHELFELNKFQHQQIELQEQLRRSLGMRIDLPLNHGLAKPGTGPKEDELLFDFHLLRGMDQLSLALLCSEELFASLAGIDSRPGGAPLSIRIERHSEFHVRLEPWPFDAVRLNFPVRCRRIQQHSFRETAEFQKVYEQAPVERVEVALSPTG